LAQKEVEIHLSVTIDPKIISKEELLKHIDELLKYEEGVGPWGELPPQFCAICQKSTEVVATARDYYIVGCPDPNHRDADFIVYMRK